MFSKIFIKYPKFKLKKKKKKFHLISALAVLQMRHTPFLLSLLAAKIVVDSGSVFEGGKRIIHALCESVRTKLLTISSSYRLR
jgi:hypothetical protein